MASWLGAIDPKTDNSQLLQGGLTADEAQTLSDAIKSSIDHSLQASFDETLSHITDDQAAFQYQIDVDAAQRDPVANAGGTSRPEGRSFRFDGAGESESKPMGPSRRSEDDQQCLFHLREKGSVVQDQSAWSAQRSLGFRSRPRQQSHSRTLSRATSRSPTR